MKLEIRENTLEHPEVIKLIETHLKHMYSITPSESVHAKGIDELKKESITFYSGWYQGKLVGCVAIQEISQDHGEIKSMRTHEEFIRQGVARQMLKYLIKVAISRSYKRLSLETGASEEFIAARKLYESMGFTYCQAFEGYSEDINSVFMTKALD